MVGRKKGETNMLNNVSLVGRLTKEPNLKVIGENTVCNFTVAVNRPFKNKDGEREADFIQCQAWNKQAEFIGSYLHKGQLVAVTGEIHTRTYTKKDDGSNAYVTEVNVNSIQSLEKRDPQNEEDIRTAWTNEWDRKSPGLDAKGKATLKKKLADKYQPMIDALKKPEKGEMPF
jgi:single-strand DNA-binding protein